MRLPIYSTRPCARSASGTTRPSRSRRGARRGRSPRATSSNPGAGCSWSQWPSMALSPVMASWSRTDTLTTSTAVPTGSARAWARPSTPGWRPPRSRRASRPVRGSERGCLPLFCSAGLQARCPERLRPERRGAQQSSHVEAARPMTGLAAGGCRVELVTQGADEVARAVLDTLPEWFGRPASLDAYVVAAGPLPTLVARSADGRAVGFATLERHTPVAAEVHVMGVSRAEHGRGHGRRPA